MLKKIIRVVILIILVPIPFLSSMLWMSKYSPYFGSNSFSVYIPISILNAVVSFLLLLLVINRQLPKPILRIGILLFLMGAVMASIGGLAAPPDFTPALLKHPEREHYRYALLFLNALLFAAAFILTRQAGFGKWQKWLLLLFVPALAEMVWEFYHHYYYAENMRIWISQGNNGDKFMDHYSGGAAIKAGAIGRFFQYSCIALLSYVLQQYSRIRKWTLIPLLLLCTMGAITAIYIFFNGFYMPGQFQLFMIFFIPGIPFILLYWIGVALLTKPSSE